MRPTETEVHVAIRTILSDRKSYDKSLNYAVNYCREALYQTGHALHVQCLYILNNLSGWRHPEAKNVRTVLKAYVK